MSAPKFKVYPSLLDKYQRLLDSEEEAKAPWNYMRDGRQFYSPAEIYARNEKALLDAVNRAPHAPIPAADRGTAYNELVDCLVEWRKPAENFVFVTRSHQAKGYDPALVVDVTLNGNTYPCLLMIAQELRRRLAGSTCQVLLSAPIETDNGTVELYGYADYVRSDQIIDLKTTSSYEWPQYANYWQRFAYPYCAVKSGAMTEVSMFRFLAVELPKEVDRIPAPDRSKIGDIIYNEDYTDSIEECEDRLRIVLNGFTGWLLAHKEQITDRKIFGGEND